MRHLYVRRGFRSAFQSRRHTGECESARNALARCSGYIAAQGAGAMLGLWAAHLMFAEPVLQVPQHVRAGSAQLFSEFIATFGLLSDIWRCGRLRTEAVPFAVGLYITGAYWFTASTSFANPAVTPARVFTNTF